MFSCEFCEIFKNAFFYRTPPAAASETKIIYIVEDDFIKEETREIETISSFHRKMESTTTTTTADGVVVLPRSQHVNAVDQMKTFPRKKPEVISLNRSKYVHPLIKCFFTKNLSVTSPLAR